MDKNGYKADFLNAERAMQRLIGTTVYQIDFYNKQPICMRGKVIGIDTPKSSDDGSSFFYKTKLKRGDDDLAGCFEYVDINKTVFFSKEAAETAISIFNSLLEMWKESME